MPATNDITGDRLVTKANTKEYEENYTKTFGEKKTQKGSWVYDPEKRKLVPKEEYGPNSRGSQSWQVMEDIKPYQSVINGQEITSRNKHRAHLRQHNCVEVGNEKQKPKAMPDVGGRREDIQKAIYQLTHR